MRLAEARKDRYRKLAKDQGYRSRSSFKLLQLNDSYKVIRRGDSVVDLGCAPGGWVQVSKKILGDSGKVIGIDLKKVDPIDGAIIMQGNLEDPQAVMEVTSRINGKADVLLSDLAPNVSGIWDIDHSRQISLTRIALLVAQKVLKKKGRAVFKVFQGDELKGLQHDMRNNFEKVIISKPTASRQESSELYLVCLDFKGEDANNNNNDPQTAYSKAKDINPSSTANN